MRTLGHLTADNLDMPGARARELVLAHAWGELAGQALARHARVLGLRRGLLTVEASDARWLAALVLVALVASGVATAWIVLGH